MCSVVYHINETVFRMVSEDIKPGRYFATKNQIGHWNMHTKQVLSVEVKPGWKAGTKITFQAKILNK
jgi:hypothetical protein